MLMLKSDLRQNVHQDGKMVVTITNRIEDQDASTEATRRITSAFSFFKPLIWRPLYPSACSSPYRSGDRLEYRPEMDGLSVYGEHCAPAADPELQLCLMVLCYLFNYMERH